MTERSLESLADELALRNLLVWLSLEADTGDLADYAKLLAPEAVMDTPLGRRESRDEIIAWNQDRRDRGLGGPGIANRHHTVPGLIRLDGDRAQSRSYFEYYTSGDDGPQVASFGEYNDQFEKRNGTWVLVSRVVTFG